MKVALRRKIGTITGCLNEASTDRGIGKSAGPQFDLIIGVAIFVWQRNLHALTQVQLGGLLDGVHQRLDRQRTAIEFGGIPLEVWPHHVGRLFAGNIENPTRNDRGDRVEGPGTIDRLHHVLVVVVRNAAEVHGVGELAGVTNEHRRWRLNFGTSRNDTSNGVGEFGQRNRHRQFLVIGDVEPVACHEHCVGCSRQQVQKTKAFFSVEIPLSNAGRIKKDVVAIATARSEGPVVETEDGNNACGNATKA